MPEKIELVPIGTIRSPFKTCGETPIQAAHAMETEAAIEVLPGYVEGLDDLDGFDCIWVIWYCHQARPGSLKVVPYLDIEKRGVFATRAPSRPNPIGLSCVRLLRREDNKLVIQGVDMIDGTPVLDLKPYVPSIDGRADCRRDGWIGNRPMKKMADDRFLNDNKKGVG